MKKIPVVREGIDGHAIFCVWNMNLCVKNAHFRSAALKVLSAPCVAGREIIFGITAPRGKNKFTSCLPCSRVCDECGLQHSACHIREREGRLLGALTQRVCIRISGTSRNTHLKSMRAVKGRFDHRHTSGLLSAKSSVCVCVPLISHHTHPGSDRAADRPRGYLQVRLRISVNFDVGVLGAPAHVRRQLRKRKWKTKVKQQPPRLIKNVPIDWLFLIAS
jgi:hypothetical protein